MRRRAFVKSGALAVVSLGLSPALLRLTALERAAQGAARKTLIGLFHAVPPMR